MFNAELSQYTHFTVEGRAQSREKVVMNTIQPRPRARCQANMRFIQGWVNLMLKIR